METELRLLGVGAAAARLGVAVATLRRLVARREIPAVRINRRVLIASVDLVEFVRLHRVPAADGAAPRRRRA